MARPTDAERDRQRIEAALTEVGELAGDMVGRGIAYREEGQLWGRLIFLASQRVRAVAPDPEPLIRSLEVLIGARPDENGHGLTYDEMVEACLRRGAELGRAVELLADARAAELNAVKNGTIGAFTREQRMAIGDFLELRS
jgi:hypothetical protein